MADSTIAALSAASALTGTELFYADSGAADVKVTATQIQTFAVAGMAPLKIEDANTVSQRNGTNKQYFQVFSTYTDGSNHAGVRIGKSDDGFNWGIANFGVGTGASQNNDAFRIGGNWDGASFAVNANQIVTIGGGTLYLGGGGNTFAMLAEVGLELDMAAGYTQMTERTAPSAPAADKVRIYAVDNGSGKTQLMALFSSGAAQQLAIQP